MSQVVLKMDAGSGAFAGGVQRVTVTPSRGALVRQVFAFELRKSPNANRNRNRKREHTPDQGHQIPFRTVERNLTARIFL